MVTSNNEEQHDARIKAAEQAALQQGEHMLVNELEQHIPESARKVEQVAGTVLAGATQLQEVAGKVPVQPGPPPLMPGFGATTGNNKTPEQANKPVEKSQDKAASDEDPVAWTCADISVGDYEIAAFESFQLFQSTGTHHSFELVIAHDALRAQDGSAVVDDQWLSHAGKLLGANISIGFYYNIWPGKKRIFEGVITNVGYRRDTYGFGDIVFTGGSPTLLLDSAPHIQSFTDKPLDNIVKDLLGQGGIDTAGVSSHYKPSLPYTCQYNETHYNYLARLAAHYGEWFYYDGQQLYFGKPDPKPEVKLVLGRDVSDIQAQMNGQHVQPQRYGYNSSDHLPLESQSYEISGMEQMGATALKASRKIYKTPAMQVAPLRALGNDDITLTQKSAATAVAAALFTVEGTTTNPYLFPGCVIELEFRDVTSNKTEHYAKLIVTELRQTLEYDGTYRGSFTAVSSKTENLPFPYFSLPVAEPQLATVTDNEDSKGRVKVKFPWQENPTDFIRVMTPDAGSSDKVGTNRGFVAIPEIGDQVLVGFLHSHPDRPFVMGGMFHGAAGGGGGTGNNVKSLTSKSGHTMQLDDSGGMTIKDKTGDNHIVVDGDNKVTVTAANTILLTNGKSNIVMDGDSIVINAKNVYIVSEETNVSGSKSIALHTPKASINGSDNVEIKGKEIEINATATATLSGNAKTTVSAVGQTSIEGAIVKLN